MKVIIFLLISLFLLQAHCFKGSVYELNSNRGKLLYNIERTNNINDNKEFLSLVFKEPNGTLAVTEEAYFTDDQLTKYSVTYHRRNEKGLIEVKNGKVYFTYTKDGKTKTNDEKWVDNFIVGLSTNKFILKNWDALLDGKTLNVRFGVDYRRDTVGFNLFRTKETSLDIMTIKMKPSSFIISALVDPVYMDYDVKTKKLIAFRGRVRPKQNVNGKWKDLDGETVYIW
ncbi:MAG: hypothetical protein KDD40_02235 [Bdellovibrionales bacterium]|nr:hypothetical protein [Bdellovibrionales bacterium]